MVFLTVVLNLVFGNIPAFSNDVAIEEGVAQLSDGNLDSALEAFEVALKDTGESPECWRKIWAALYPEKTRAMGVSVFERLAEARPGQYTALFYFGAYQVDSAADAQAIDPDKTLTALNAALKAASSERERSWVIYYLGLFHSKVAKRGDRSTLKSFQKSLDAFQETLKLDPARSDAIVQIGSVAKELWDKANEIRGSDPSETAEPTIVEIYETAIGANEFLAERSPKSSSVWNNLGLFQRDLAEYLRSKKDERATSWFEASNQSYQKAIELSPFNNAQLANDYALSVENLGRHAEALELFIGALKQNFTLPDALLGVIRVYRKLEGEAKELALEKVAIFYEELIHLNEKANLHYGPILWFVLDDIESAYEIFRIRAVNDPKEAYARFYLEQAAGLFLHDKRKDVLSLYPESEHEAIQEKFKEWEDRLKKSESAQKK